MLKILNFSSKIKKFLTYLIFSLIISILLSLIYIFTPKTLDSFDNQLRDFMFKVRGEIDDNNNVVIIDIDEKSLSKIGQWPWSRDNISKMLINLTNSGVAIIGFDIVFAEEDRTSPHKLLKKYDLKIQNNIKLPNFDKELADTLAETPTILGYQFQLENNKFSKQETVITQALIVEKNSNRENIISAKGTILNIPMIQNSAYSSGFFNNVPDDSGIIRSLPLIIQYQDEIFPSLSLEILRIALNSNRLDINYDDLGVSDIKVSDIIIPTDRYGRLYINFRGKEKTFKYISAIDILNNNFNPNDIQDKIVLIGTSAAGLLDLRATPFESIFPGVEVHANAIDNILQQDFIYKPAWVDGVNIIIIITLTILIFMLVGYLRYFFILISIISLTGTTLYILYSKTGRFAPFLHLVYFHKNSKVTIYLYQIIFCYLFLHHQTL